MIDDIRDLRNKVNQALAKKELLEKQLSDEREKLIKNKKRLEGCHQAREVVIEVARKTQANLENRLSELVSLCLATVFPNPYELSVKFIQRRNAVEADLTLVRNGEEYKPMDDSGGGVLNVASFGLRVGLWSLSDSRPTILVDEPFANLSPKKHQYASKMAKMLCDKLGIQIIMISHNPNILDYADKIFVVENGKVVENTNG